MKNLIVLAFLFVQVIGAHAAYDINGGYVTLCGDNSGNKYESTFVTNILRTSYGWSDQSDPHPGTNYFAAYQLCTPYVKNWTGTFAGDRLVVAAGLRFLNDGQDVTINDLVMERQGFMHMAANEFHITLRGNLTILGTEANPSFFQVGRGKQRYDIQSRLVGNQDAYFYVYRNEQVPGIVEIQPTLTFANANEYNGMVNLRDSVTFKLDSDMPGTISLATNTATFKPLKNVTIGSFVTTQESTLDLADGGLIITTSYSIGRKLNLLLPSVGSGTFVTVSKTAGMLSLDDFNLPSGARFRYELKENADYQMLVRTDLLDFTGYVTQVKNVTDAFGKAEAWSDNNPVQAHGNYKSDKGLRLMTETSFPSDGILALSNTMRFDTRTFTVGDLVVLPGTATDFYLTTAGGSGTYTLDGKMTVLSMRNDLKPLVFFGGATGQRWAVNMTLVGDENSKLEVTGHLNAQMETPQRTTYTDFLGDTSKYYGLISIWRNGVVTLSDSAFPGEIELKEAGAGLEMKGRAGVASSTVDLAKLTVKDSSSTTWDASGVKVTSGNTLAVTETFSVKGTLLKKGEGVLALGCAPTLDSAAALNVTDGSIRPLSANCIGALSVTFASGTGISLDWETMNDEVSMKGLDLSSSALTLGEKLAVSFTSENEVDRRALRAICTVKASDAAAVAAALQKPTLNIDSVILKGNVVRGAEKDGKVVFFATFQTRGMIVYFK